MYIWLIIDILGGEKIYIYMYKEYFLVSYLRMLADSVIREYSRNIVRRKTRHRDSQE